jgi:hypothetical protein
MNRLLNIFILLLVSNLVKASSNNPVLVAENTSDGVLVYISNTTSMELAIKNTLNLRGKGSSLSPVSLEIMDTNGNTYREVLVVDPADEATCLILRRGAVHGIVYSHDHIKQKFHLAPGVYRVKAIYQDFYCSKKTPSEVIKLESKMFEVSID